MEKIKSIKIENEKREKNQKGITLVALVVTIVVLLILAGITITALFGDNGIISQAQKAKDATENDQKNTEQGLANLADKIDKLTGNYDEQTGWNLDKVTKVVVDGQNIPVPIGYSLSQATGENSVNTGLVLYQDIEGKEGSEENIVNDSNVATARTTRNQFVWVPVQDVIYDGKTTITSGTYTPMAKSQGDSSENYIGMLYTFSGTTATYQSSYAPGSTTYREPDVVTSASSGADNASGNDYDAKPDYLTQAGLPAGSTANDFRKQLQKEFNSMVTSVEKYGGFYIGRYETSGLSNSDTTVKPTVQKGKTTINNTTWYRMYNESKNIKANDNVTSSMIWGCQWDQVMNWWLKDNATKGYVAGDCTTKGNYAGTNGNQPIATGHDGYDIKNIYDMAGNVWDWTIEAYSTYTRVGRRRQLLRFRFWPSSFLPRRHRHSDQQQRLRWFPLHFVNKSLNTELLFVQLENFGTVRSNCMSVNVRQLLEKINNTLDKQ